MFQKYADSYVTKYQSPFTAFLDTLTAPDAEVDDGCGAWALLYGRHILYGDTQGFVDHMRMDGGERAELRDRFFQTAFVILGIQENDEDVETNIFC